MIITSKGVVGACSAALLLQVHGEQPVRLSTEKTLADFLEGVVSEFDLEIHSKLHIVNIYINRDDNRLFGFVDQLVEAGASLTFYYGRAETVPHDSPLREGYDLVYLERESTTQTIHEFFKLPDTKVTRQLLKMSSLYIRSQPDKAENRKKLANKIMVANRKVLLEGEHRFFEQLVHHLAFGGHINPEYDSEFEKFEEEIKRYCWFDSGSAEARVVQEVILHAVKSEVPFMVYGQVGTGRRAVVNRIGIHSAGVARVLDIDSSRYQVFRTEDLAELKARIPLAEVSEDRSKYIPGKKILAYFHEIDRLAPEYQAFVYEMVSTEVYQNLRVAGSSKVDLFDRVSNGEFREDLYYVLNRLPISLKPLYQREKHVLRSDLFMVLKQMAEEGAIPHSCELDDADWKAVFLYPWPGNISEFACLVSQAHVTGSSLHTIIRDQRAGTGGDDPVFVRPEDHEYAEQVIPAGPDEVKTLEYINFVYARKALNLFRGNKKQTYTALGISYNTLIKTLKQKKKKSN